MKENNSEIFGIHLLGPKREAGRYIRDSNKPWVLSQRPRS